MKTTENRDIHGELQGLLDAAEEKSDPTRRREREEVRAELDTATLAYEEARLRLVKARRAYMEMLSWRP